jgi:hypothetical protein
LFIEKKFEVFQRAIAGSRVYFFSPNNSIMSGGRRSLQGALVQPPPIRPAQRRPILPVQHRRAVQAACSRCQRSNNSVAVCLTATARCKDCCFDELGESILNNCSFHFSKLPKRARSDIENTMLAMELDIHDKDEHSRRASRVRASDADSDSDSSSGSDDDSSEDSSGEDSPRPKRKKTAQRLDRRLSAMEELLDSVLQSHAAAPPPQAQAAAQHSQAVAPVSRGFASAPTNSLSVPPPWQSDSSIYRSQALGTDPVVQHQVASAFAGNNAVSVPNAQHQHAFPRPPSPPRPLSDPSAAFSAVMTQAATFQRMKEEVESAYKSFKTKEQLHSSLQSVLVGFLQRGQISVDGAMRPLTAADMLALSRLSGEVMRAANDVSLDFAAEYLAQLILEIKYNGIPPKWYRSDPNAEFNMVNCWTDALVALKKRTGSATSHLSNNRAASSSSNSSSRRSKRTASKSASVTPARSCPNHPNATSHTLDECKLNTKAKGKADAKSDTKSN